MSWIVVAAVGAVGAGVGSSLLKSGKKPKVPYFPEIDMDALQKLAISGNMAALPGVTDLASRVNASNQAELYKSREAAAPGALDLIRKNINDELSGVADIADTRAGIRNATAAGFKLGAGGKSQFNQFGVVGQLGRSVSQRKQQGFSNFLNLASSLDAPRMDPASMFFSPAQRLANAQFQAQNKFNVDMARAAIAAQPSRTSQALGAGLGVVSNLAGMAFGAKMGGGGGFGGGGGSAPSGGYSSGWNPTTLTGSMGSTAPAGGSFNFPGQPAQKRFGYSDW